MKRPNPARICVSIFAIGMLSALLACGEKVETGPSSETPTPIGISRSEELPERVLRHAVFFAYRENVTDEQIEDIETAFAALQDSIPGILAYEHGKNNSPEKLNNGLTHAYLLTFGSEADRNAYLPHPAHARFGEKLSPLLKDVMVVDFWSAEN